MSAITHIILSIIIFYIICYLDTNHFYAYSTHQQYSLPFQISHPSNWTSQLTPSGVRFLEPINDTDGVVEMFRIVYSKKGEFTIQEFAIDKVESLRSSYKDFKIENIDLINYYNITNNTLSDSSIKNIMAFRYTYTNELGLTIIEDFFLILSSNYDIFKIYYLFNPEDEKEHISEIINMLKSFKVIQNVKNDRTTGLSIQGSPNGIAIDEKNNVLYVAIPYENNVYVMDMKNNGTIRKINVDEFPIDIEINSFTNKVYISNSESNTITVIDSNTGDIRNITVDKFPFEIGPC